LVDIYYLGAELTMGFARRRGRGGKNVMPESFTLTACRLFSGKAQNC